MGNLRNTFYNICTNLSDLLPFDSLVFVAVLFRCLGILECLWFSFPLSHSLSDVRSVSLLGIRTITTG